VLELSIECLWAAKQPDEGRHEVELTPAPRERRAFERFSVRSRAALVVRNPNGFNLLRVSRPRHAPFGMLSGARKPLDPGAAERTRPSRRACQERKEITSDESR
jgi:hypothetical protein